MQIKAPFTGQIAFSDILVQKKTSHILVVSNGVPIVNEKIAISLNVSGTQSNIVPAMKIRDVALKSQFRNGYMSTVKEADGTTTHEWLIALSPDGRSVELVNDNTISVSLSALTAGNTYTLYAVDAPHATRQYLATSTQSIAGSEPQQKVVNIVGVTEALYIRNNGGLAGLRLWFNTGEECNYFPAELRAVTRELNQLTESADQTIEGDTINQTVLNGAQEMFYFPAREVVKYEITTTGGIDVVVFTDEIKQF